MNLTERNCVIENYSYDIIVYKLQHIHIPFFYKIILFHTNVTVDWTKLKDFNTVHTFLKFCCSKIVFKCYGAVWQQFCGYVLN